MDYERFIAIVEQQAGVGSEPAKRAARATLETLAERISEGEARDLAGQLPPEVSPWLFTSGPAQPFDVGEFLRRVAEREEVDSETAERHAAAVFAALGRAVSPEELADVLSELPRDYARLMPRGRRDEVVKVEAFLRRVADRALVDEDTAWQATQAVLETLAERIAGGEVDDLIVHLPVQLHPPLKRGKELSGGKATRMPLDEFVDRVAEREGVDHEQAREHARAVLSTLREVIPDREVFDVTVQLPDEYDVLLEPA
jgi:uncharacterized protein (DUF2267 family)